MTAIRWVGAILVLALYLASLWQPMIRPGAIPAPAGIPASRIHNTGFDAIRYEMRSGFGFEPAPGHDVVTGMPYWPALAGFLAHPLFLLGVAMLCANQGGVALLCAIAATGLSLSLLGTMPGYKGGENAGLGTVLLLGAMALLIPFAWIARAYQVRT